jgi:hypothetical protein
VLELCVEFTRRAALAPRPTRIRRQGLPQDRLVRPDLLGPAARRYFMSLRTGVRSHVLIVFLDRLVRRAISLIDKPSRNRILRTFAYIAMVCTSISLLGFHLAGTVGTPWSIFSEQNRDSLVSFQRAATPCASLQDLKYCCRAT